MSLSDPIKKPVVRNLIIVLALFIVLSSSPIVSVSAFGTSSAQSAISPLTKYPITLESPNAQKGGWFGNSVAFSGKLAIVGAYDETVDADPGAGHAYIFNATGSLIRTLTSPNAQYGGVFGSSVAISGNLAIVGAPGEYGDGNWLAGNAYVFNATTGGLICNLTSPHPQEYGEFGMSVAVSGELAIVGAPGENSTANGAQYAGNAYVFNATTGSLIKTLTSPNAQETGEFGWSVAISGELAIVGAPNEMAQGNIYAGHAYIFNATGSLIRTLTSPNAQIGGWFGWSVADSGDLAIVGAYDETVNGYSYAGHAYVFNSITGKVIKQLKSPHAQNFGEFGWSIAISGNLAIVGTGAGHAYVFKATTGSLIQTLTSPHAQKGGWFGWSVAISGKLAIVGAPGEAADGHGRGSGHAYIFN